MTDNLKSKIGILAVSDLVRWVRSVVGVHYDVRFEEDAQTAYVDYTNKRIVIPTPNAQMSLRDAIRLRGFCIHETSHPIYQPKLAEVVDKYPVKQGSPLAGVFNLVLDCHAESMRAADYPGDMKALSEFGAVVGHDVTEKVAEGLKDNGNVWPKGFDKMATVLCAMRNAESTWNIGMLVGFAKLVDELYPPEWVAKAVELEKKFDLTRRLVTEGSKEDEWTLFDLAKQIYEYLWEQSAESQMAPAKGKGKGKKEKGEKGEPSSGADGDGDDGDEGESQEGDEDESDGDGDEADKDADGEASNKKRKTKLKVTDLLKTDHYETSRKGGGHGMGFDYTNYTSYRTYTPVDPATFRITKYGAKR
jgi:hypothetical protein